jgi:hypothetical protein
VNKRRRLVLLSSTALVRIEGERINAYLKLRPRRPK